ncbi:Golgi transport complex subunit 5-domain-containing protein [Peziza echinospora]|nr:Golgi transport complex subunit 5-domain-containing protein [Peziza echinospora]
MSTSTPDPPSTSAPHHHHDTPDEPEEEEEEDTTYIDYETFLSPTFSAASFANALITHTNSTTTTTSSSSSEPLDLTTPLSRVLFDLQEIESHIYTLTTTHAVPLLTHSSTTYAASSEYVAQTEEKLAGIVGAWGRLDREVSERARCAGEVGRVVERVGGVVGVLRGVGRVVVLGRQVEVGVAEALAGAGGNGEALVRVARVVAELRGVVREDRENGGGVLEGVENVRGVLSGVVVPVEGYLREVARGVVVGSASVSSGGGGDGGGGGGGAGGGGAGAGGVNLSVINALQILVLLQQSSQLQAPKDKEPTLLEQTIKTYITTLVTTSLSALSRVLAGLGGSTTTSTTTSSSTPSSTSTTTAIGLGSEDTAADSSPALTRSLAEIEHKLSLVLLMEGYLDSLDSLDPTTTTTTTTTTQTQLTHITSLLDTPSLATHFTRSLGEGLETLVRNVVMRGGAPARGVRAGRERVREGLRGVVERGFSGGGGKKVAGGSGGSGASGYVRREISRGEREAGVAMVVGGWERGFGRG